MQELYVLLLALNTPIYSGGGVGLSDNQISFSTNTVNGWQGLGGGSRAAVAVGENTPLKMESSLGHALYLHPIEQAGTYIYNSKDELVTRSGAPLPNDGNLLRVEHHDAGTRGAKYNGTGWTSSFGVSAIRTDKGNQQSSFFQNLKATPDGGSWVTNDPQYWPTAGSLSFYAYAPYCDDSHKMLSESVDKTVANAKTVHYVASATDIVNQPDLIIAKHENVTHGSTDAPNSVSLNFSHVLTAITFSVGSDMTPGTVKSITIKGVKNAGDYDLASQTWKNQSGSVDFKLQLGTDGNGLEVTGQKDVALTTGDKTLMMIPQTLGSDAKIEILFNDKREKKDRTLTASLNNTIWDAGSTIVYQISTSALQPTLTLGTVTFPVEWKCSCYGDKMRSEFKANDKIGIYVVDQTGLVKKANLPATYNGTTWTLDNGQTIRFNAMDHFFAYYPYQATQNNLPTVATTIDVATQCASANIFFKNMETAWTPRKDQSNKESLDASDLQVGMGQVSNTGVSVNFSMQHTMGLADIQLGSEITYKLDSGEPYTWNGGKIVSDNIQGPATPYKINDAHYVAIVKPGTHQFNATASADRPAWRSPLSFTLSAGDVDRQTAMSANNTNQTYKLEVGDIYYSDGSLSHQKDNLIQGKTPIGVVVYIAKGNDDYWVEKNTDGCKHGGHALVMCRKEVNSTGWESHVAYVFGATTDYHREKMNTAEKIKKSGDKPYGSGYLETKAYVDMGVQIANMAKNYKEYSAPLDKSTGWFLPSAGQMCSMCYQLDSNFEHAQWEINDLSNSPLTELAGIETKLENFLKKFGTDNTEFVHTASSAYSTATSSEYDESYMVQILTSYAWYYSNAFMFFTDLNYRFSSTKAQQRYDVRPFLAF